MSIAAELVELLCVAGTVQHLTLEGKPERKERARRNSATGRWYTPSKTRVAETAVAWQLKTLRPYLRNVAVACVFYRPNRQPIDVDNLTKLVLDAGTKAGLWHDDRQVTAQLALLEYDPARPRTEVWFGEPKATTMHREGRLQAPLALEPVIAPF